MNLLSVLGEENLPETATAKDMEQIKIAQRGGCSDIRLFSYTHRFYFFLILKIFIINSFLKKIILFADSSKL